MEAARSGRSRASSATRHPEQVGEGHRRDARGQRDPRRRRRAHRRQHDRRDNVTVQARTDQALIDATAEVAANRDRREDAVSFKLGLANGNLGVGAVARAQLHRLGHRHRFDATARRPSTRCSARASARPRRPWVVQAYIRDSALTATGDLPCGRLGAADQLDGLEHGEGEERRHLRHQVDRGRLHPRHEQGLEQVEAFIEFTGATPGIVTVGGDLEVAATDDAGVYSNAKIVASSITTNDGGVPSSTRIRTPRSRSSTTATEGSRRSRSATRCRLVAGLRQPDYTAAVRDTEGHVPRATSSCSTIATAASHLTTASGIRLLTFGDTRLVEDGYENGGFDGHRLPLPRRERPRRPRRPGLLGQTLWAPVGGNAGSV